MEKEKKNVTISLTRSTTLTTNHISELLHPDHTDLELSQKPPVQEANQKHRPQKNRNPNQEEQTYTQKQL
jgi:hypothetical protein